MKPIFADWWQSLLNLIFPPRGCICCGNRDSISGDGLCENCQNIFEGGDNYLASCQCCPIFVPAGETYCINCRRGNNHWFDAAAAVFPYEGEIRQVIHDFKYRGGIKWAKPLGSLMAKIVQEDSRFQHIDMVIPVPLHERREKMRGYNQSELLAGEIGRQLGFPVAGDIMKRVRNTPPQTGLNKEGRQENLADAFHIFSYSYLQGKSILLVDDIYTTGSTVETCSRILKIGGAKTVLVVTCAAGKGY